MLSQNGIMQNANGLNDSDKMMDPALKDELPQPPDHSNQISHQQYTDPSFAAQQFARSAAATSNGISGRPGAPVLPAPPHGYSANQSVEQDAHIHPELRPLREATASQGHAPAPAPNMMQAGVPPHAEGAGGPPHPSSSVSPSMEAADMGDVVMADGRKAKRELSQSKRAAQNRAAQRAFRQRKELHIKKLEQEVREYKEMESNFKAMQAENYALRQYVINLQSRLLDAHGEYPLPPPGLSLGPHLPHGGLPQGAPGNAEPAQAAPSTPGAATSLEVVAQAVGLARGDPQVVAGLPTHLNRASKGDRDPGEEDSRTDEEIGRQLQADGSLPSAPM